MPWNVKPAKEKEEYLWTAEYFFSRGGSVRFIAMARTAGDVAEMLKDEVDHYRDKDICSVEIIREPNMFKYIVVSYKEPEE